MLKKNWDGTVKTIEKRLNQWKKVLPHLSYKGRVLVANNLVSSLLWHKAICLQPLEARLRTVQGKLLDVFMGRPSLATAKCYIPFLG